MEERAVVPNEGLVGKTAVVKGVVEAAVSDVLMEDGEKWGEGNQQRINPGEPDEAADPPICDDGNVFKWFLRDGKNEGEKGRVENEGKEHDGMRW